MFRSFYIIKYSVYDVLTCPQPDNACMKSSEAWKRLLCEDWSLEYTNCSAQEPANVEYNCVKYVQLFIYKIPDCDKLSLYMQVPLENG